MNQPQTFVLHPGESRERVLGNLQRFLAALGADKAWQVEVKPWRKKRSAAQNAALWGIAYKTLEQATGQEAKDWHEFMLGEYFGTVQVELLGRKYTKPRRGSSGLSTVEFADYYAFVQRRAAEHGIFIADPDPFYDRKAA